jgi:AAHS family 4-hydroxybenzoate transporter-like MFS transporter
MKTAPSTATVDVASIFDDVPISSFHILLVTCCILIALADGYDIAVIGVAAPSLVREWKIANLGALVPVFTAGVIGGVVGPLILGMLSDRFGRKTVLLSSAALFGVMNLLTMAVSDLQTMTVLRLLIGMILGGIIPTAASIAVEYSPLRWKLTFSMIVNIGVVGGAGLPGLVAIWLVPTYGWQSLYFVGGAVPLVLSLLFIPVIPESLKFLAFHPRRNSQVTRALARLRPDLRVDDQTRYFDSSSPIKGTRLGLVKELKLLFVGRLAIITPLLWFSLMVSYMSTYFFQTWLPTLITGLGLPASQAALSFSWFALGGVVATATLCRPINKYGIPLLTLLFVISVPIVATLGVIASSRDLLALAMMAAGFCLNGLLSGTLAFSGVVYPTLVRSTGIGWTLGMGRLGGAAGPFMGGVLVGLGVPLRQLTYVAATPLALGIVASLILAWVFHASGREVGETMS